MAQAVRGRDPPGLAQSQGFRAWGGMSKGLRSHGPGIEQGSVIVLRWPESTPQLGHALAG